MATDGPRADEEQRLPLLVGPERPPRTAESTTISPTDSAEEPKSCVAQQPSLGIVHMH